MYGASRLYGSVRNNGGMRNFFLILVITFGSSILTVGPFKSFSSVTKKCLIETGHYSRTSREYKMCKAQYHLKSFNISNSKTVN
jgi:hypothetical protein